MASKQNIGKDKILITGVTGYIGFRTLNIALEKGYFVRAVVRSESNVADLKSKSVRINGAFRQGQLEFALVPDFLREGEIAKALAGITAIIHIASPLAIEGGDYDAAIIDPAVSMVTTVLQAAAQVPSIRRVIITTSCATLIPFEWNMNPNSQRLYTSADLNATPSRPFHSAMEAYWASKALARTATKNFMTTHEPQFDVVNLLPSVVIGRDDRIPANGYIDELLQGARAAVMARALDNSLNSAFPYVGVAVNVADVARAHVDAIDTDLVPGNTEYILSSDTPDGVVWDRDIANIAQKYFPSEVESRILPMEGSLASIKWLLDASTTERIFGWEFTSFEETMRDMIAQYLQLKIRKN